jgi:hypothetical protein
MRRTVGGRGPDFKRSGRIRCIILVRYRKTSLAVSVDSVRCQDCDAVSS